MTISNTDFDILSEAEALARDIEEALRGHTTAAAYLAIGLVLGAIQAEADKPDVEGLLSVLRKVIGEQIGEGPH
jgi:hypothetical protein